MNVGEAESRKEFVPIEISFMQSAAKLCVFLWVTEVAG